jgi:hypothetical protein
MKARRPVVLLLGITLQIGLAALAPADGELLSSGHTYLQAQTLRWLDG